MTEHGWPSDAWPGIYQKILAADILVLAGPIWLGDNSSVTKQVIERLYACSHLLNQAGNTSTAVCTAQQQSGGRRGGRCRAAIWMSSTFVSWSTAAAERCR
jgi:multimeric flavodoxin WrbA